MNNPRMASGPVFINGDWKDADAIIQEYENLLADLGYFVYVDPATQDSDTYGVIVSEVEMDDNEIQEASDAEYVFKGEDEEGEIDLEDPDFEGGPEEGDAAMDEAIEYISTLIDDGYELDHAIEEAAAKYNFTEEDLEMEYGERRALGSYGTNKGTSLGVSDSGDGVSDIEVAMRNFIAEFEDIVSDPTMTDDVKYDPDYLIDKMRNHLEYVGFDRADFTDDEVYDMVESLISFV